MRIASKIESGMKMMPLNLLVGCLLIAVRGLEAKTVQISNFGDGTCSAANVQSACNTSSAGDVIVFPAGSYTWEPE